MDIKKLQQDLIRHEGLRLKVYDDATGQPITRGDTLEGYPTIGIGRNLSGRGITEAEAKELLFNDIDYYYKKLRKVHAFNQLDGARQRVIMNMTFNLGFTGVRLFKKMWRAIEQRDYNEASFQMLDSLWAEQVGERANELALIMRHGENEET